MKRYLENRSIARYLLALSFAATLATSLPSLAATVALATEPLISTTTSTVKPNVMFILDDSGTMSYNYLPDWASGYTSKPELHTNAGFNGVAYNAAVTYTPPVFYDTAGVLNTTTYPTYNNTGTAVWTAVKRDGFGVLSNSTDNLVGNASYYTFVNGEYCSTVKKTSCVTATAATTVGGVTYDKPAGLRWCDSAALTNCQSIKDSTYTFPRYPGQVVPATATITVTGSGNATGITVNGYQIMSGTAASSNNLRTIASNIVTAINNCTAAATGNCTIAGYSAKRLPNTSTVEISAPSALGAITYLPVATGAFSKTITAFSGGQVVPGSNVYTDIVSTTTSYAYPGTASKAATRTDCVGTTCTYAEEMTNYANWWAYYHTRLQAMKTSVSRAFKALNQNYRVGFSTICDTSATTGTNFLAVDTFETTQKYNWFTKLFSTGTSCWTPLRGALSKTGRYYAHKVGSVDPLQYSCQQNFAILSTDGYWNTDVETSTFGPYGLTGANVGDQDNDPTTRSSGMYQGPTATSNSLADVAKYYYETDLRTSALSNCTGVLGSDVCTNNVFTSPTDNKVTQHMTTFTMGLGADGVLNFQTDYETATSGDFYDLTHALGTPTMNWPVPAANSASAIDDLWHAAVNGRGQYFSAKDPDQIINGFNKALTSISSKKGAAAAAATSTLNPVAGNNFVYLASYTTIKWTGNIEARSINTVTAAVSDTATWCAADVKQDSCASPATIVPVTSGSSTIYNCVLTGATLASCPSPGVFDAVNNICTTEMTNSCVGSLTLANVTGTSSDNRTIYTAPAGGLTPLSGQNLVPFDSAYATANPASFNPSTASPAGPVDGLTQWGTISTSHTPAKLISYLRGQTGYEMGRTGNAEQLYRNRETVMGDALESQPAFIASPVFSYIYPGYSDFKTAHATREGMVYVGSNDGMLHAFYGQDGTGAGNPCVIGGGVHCGGEEAWAFVPTAVIGNMWKLADSQYSIQGSGKHTNFFNGSPNIADVCVSSCSTAAAVWKTILVSGLNAGGREYFALDITNPASPVLLWEFTNTSDPDLGYSYGRPVIARKADGTWVVVVTSGYNNTNAGTGSGIGYLFVLDAATGSIISKISTGVGTSATPSGLAQVAVWNDAEGGNQAGYAYATDLRGNIWRFDINSATAATGVRVVGNGTVMKFATLYSNTTGTLLPQPITTVPVLGLVNSTHVIYVGTGKYLETTDNDDQQVQSYYAIKDVGASATWLDNPRSHVGSTTLPNMIQQTITPSGNVRTGSRNPVDFSTDLGWFVDFPDMARGSERVNIASKLVQGVLLVPTIVPAATACSPGGYGWFNFFDYSNGWPVDGGTSNNNVSVKFDSPIVGFNIVYIGGKPKLLVVTADGKIEARNDVMPGIPPDSGGFQSHKAIWRELVP